LLSDEGAKKFIDEMLADYERIRHQHANRKSVPLVSLQAARDNYEQLDWGTYKPSKPKFIGRRVFKNFSLAEIAKFIDWTPFFQTWDLAGKFPAILDDEIVGDEARKVYADAQAMLEKLIKGQWLQADAIVGLFPANSQGDDILLYPDESRSKPFLIWHNLRQQSERPVVDEDYVGCFALTTGHGVEEKVAQFLAKHDDYSAIMLKALADRLAEAFAELMHWRVRTDLWGYAPGEQLTTEELIDEKYQGIRPAPGYPACPDHQVKFAMFHAMKADEIGMTLTESLAMNPASSVSGFYIANPNAMYFNVGKVASDQVGDFARRAGQSPEEVRRSLASLLD
jgi:5-methyltetrahydrofolate--homocysteine methyltransferase